MKLNNGFIHTGCDEMGLTYSTEGDVRNAYQVLVTTCKRNAVYQLGKLCLNGSVA